MALPSPLINVDPRPRAFGAWARSWVYALLALLYIGMGHPAAAGDPPVFEVRDIRVEGLNNLAAGTVFTYLPVRVGDRLDAVASEQVLRALFATGFFKDVALLRDDDDVLVVRIVEQPALADVRFEGNDKLEGEQLTEALRQAGLVAGNLFDPKRLSQIENDIKQLYLSLGLYGAEVTTIATEREGNRVDVRIEINEGRPARIARIDLVGNQAIKTATLLDLFELGQKPWWNPFSSRDEYSQVKLAGDLERLRNFYLDRGYLQFAVVSQQVDISPDRSDIFITINLSEGPVYRFGQVRFSGNLIVPESELQGLLTASEDAIREGGVFSRRATTKVADDVRRRLGNEGYAFARVEPRPFVDEGRQVADLEFAIEPGQQYYVRRINFSGNQAISEEVLRRELRQFESARFQTDAVDRSRERLQRLPAVAQVEAQLKPDEGGSNLLDIDYRVAERMTGSFNFGVGYSQSEGALLNIGVTESNWLGTGKSVSLQLERSGYRNFYNLSYLNPYYTPDGISRGFSVFYKKIDASEVDVTRYLSNSYGGSVIYGVPISEYARWRFDLGLRNVEIDAADQASPEVLAYDGYDYTNFELTPTWTRDSRDRTVFATEGSLYKASLNLALPGSGLELYKAQIDSEHYFGLGERWVVRLRGNLAYGDVYGGGRDDGSSGLPFFEAFYAGGINSVRGFEERSLGPRDFNNALDGDPLGGSLRLVGGAELVFPMPFLEGANNVRMSAFYDVGNVFADTGDFDFGELRHSVGIGMVWLSPVGPLTFSVAQPLNDKAGDRPQAFQFMIGSMF